MTEHKTLDVRVVNIGSLNLFHWLGLLLVGLHLADVNGLGSKPWWWWAWPWITASLLGALAAHAKGAPERNRKRAEREKLEAQITADRAALKDAFKR